MLFRAPTVELGDVSLTVMAHFGHWFVYVPAFFAPTVLLVLGICAFGWMERRRERSRAAQDMRADRPDHLETHRQDV